MTKAERNALGSLAALQTLQTWLLQALLQELPPAVSARVEEQLRQHVDQVSQVVGSSPEVDEVVAEWVAGMLQSLRRGG